MSDKLTLKAENEKVSIEISIGTDSDIYEVALKIRALLSAVGYVSGSIDKVMQTEAYLVDRAGD